MKVGQIFNLPDDILYSVGQEGNIKDNQDNTKVIARYKVVEIDGELRGKVMVTYGNKRRK